MGCCCHTAQMCAALEGNWTLDGRILASLPTLGGDNTLSCCRSTCLSSPVSEPIGVISNISLFLVCSPVVPRCVVCLTRNPPFVVSGLSVSATLTPPSLTSCLCPSSCLRVLFVSCSVSVAVPDLSDRRLLSALPHPTPVPLFGLDLRKKLWPF